MPALKTCSVSGCPELVPTGRCTEHTRQADRRRGSAARRGYGTRHAKSFREGVLAKHPYCVLGCGRKAAHADHWPLDRQTLVLRGMDPDDPANGRGLCHPCHSSETARHQPGGWAAGNRR